MVKLPDQADSRQLIRQLFSVAAMSNSESTEVAELVQKAKQKLAVKPEILDSFLALWRIMHGLDQPQALKSSAPTTLAASPVRSIFLYGGTLLAGIGGTLLYQMNAHDLKQVFQLPGMPNLSSVWPIAYIAAAGFVGGILNGYFVQMNAVMPQWVMINGKRVFMAGWMGNAMVGAIAALTAVWLPSVSLPPGGDALESMSISARLLAAFLVGFGGSRVMTGTPVKGSDVDAAQVKLLTHLNVSNLKLYSTSLPEGSLTRESPGLPMQTLNAVQDSPAPLREAIQDLAVSDVARSSVSSLNSFLTEGGVNISGLESSIESVWKEARVVQDLLNQMPSSWSLELEQIQ